MYNRFYLNVYQKKYTIIKDVNKNYLNFKTNYYAIYTKST